ncbi:TonB family protein [Psychromonas sp. CNPT3]|uniref:energy transducer TonB n=1 Tax=Psychromonas sp. CNPT3 TaxID=314282 RepID=UPI00006E955A|nr:energy transducer TonB [Psychromonas sp. CNPT3]AGH80263.1 TonB family protein [Psychromonas sp. CNPT3]
MNILVSYFPFFIISILLYTGLLFTPQTEKTTRHITPFVSGTQSIKVQLINIQKVRPIEPKKAPSKHASAVVHTQQQAPVSIRTKKELMLHRTTSKMQTITPKTSEKTSKKAAKSKVQQVTDNKVIDTSKTTPANKHQGTLQKAQVISGKRPTYPHRARLRSQQGSVQVSFVVNSNGTTQDAKIIKSSGYRILDDAVLTFINNEKFKVALEGEKKISSKQSFTFRFELK